MSVSLSDDKGSRLLDVALKLLGHAGFTKTLGAAIRKDGGADRAVTALLREFGLLGVLNFDEDPFKPNGWRVLPEDQINSRVKGKWKFDLDKIGLHFDPGQQDGKVIRGHDLKKKLEGQPVLPAHVLDYLLEHPEIIPESWKGKAIFFWGTIYRYADGSLCVRCLSWYGGRWVWVRWLDDDWDAYNPCAVSAS